MAEDPLAILGYRPAPALPALQARPPALGYLGGQDRANLAFRDYANKMAAPVQPTTVTATGLPDVDILQRSYEAGYAERLKAQRAQEQALAGVMKELSTLNPRSNDYLPQRNALLQAAPWAVQSKQVTQILQAQEDSHKEHLGEVKALGEFSHLYNQKYSDLVKAGKPPREANELALAGALFEKNRIEFIEMGAPKEVANKVFKPDGTFDREAMAAWKGDQKRMEFDKKMAGEAKGGFVPLSQDQREEITDAVDRMMNDPKIQARLDAYNAKNDTNFTTDNAPEKAYTEGWELAKKKAEIDLRKLVNKFALSGNKIPKALEKYVDSEESDAELDSMLNARLAAPAPSGPTAPEVPVRGGFAPSTPEAAAAKTPIPPQGGNVPPAVPDDTVNHYLNLGRQTVKPK